MNRSLSIALRISVIAVALVVLGWALALVLPASEDAGDTAGGFGTALLYILSSLVLVAPLYYPVSRSNLTGRHLFGVVFLAVFGLSTVLTQIEAALFLNITTVELMTEIIRATLTSLLLAWLAVALFPAVESEVTAPSSRKNPPSTGSWVRRWLGVSCLYVVLYVTAGLLILPIIRSWYESQGTLEQNPALLLVLQIFRGAMYVAFVLPLLRSMTVKRWQASLSMAFLVPLVHGVAGLIPPNPFMPDYVRHAHMLEIGWSNFVLGLLIGFLFWKPPAASEEPAQLSEEEAGHDMSA
jgi:hypothetical protein